MSTPVVSIVGKSKVGKTTFVVKLIGALKSRGYRVGTIKHYHHDFEIDQPGKDSWRHSEAGSDVAVISAPHKLAMVRRLESELTLDEVVAGMPPVDIVLTEGYKAASQPKIEVVRQAVTRELIFGEDQLLAIVTDIPFATAVPQFDLDDASGVADLLQGQYLSKSSQVG